MTPGIEAMKYLQPFCIQKPFSFYLLYSFFVVNIPNTLIYQEMTRLSSYFLDVSCPNHVFLLRTYIPTSTRASLSQITERTLWGPGDLSPNNWRMKAYTVISTVPESPFSLLNLHLRVKMAEWEYRDRVPSRDIYSDLLVSKYVSENLSRIAYCSITASTSITSKPWET